MSYKKKKNKREACGTEEKVTALSNIVGNPFFNIQIQINLFPHKN